MSDNGDSNDDDGIRTSIGTVVSGVSDSINNNIVIARYGILGSITVLALYGISQTPLFFRYRTLSEIPNKYFHTRKSIYCRVVGTVSQQTTQQQNEQPIILLVRHLSPAERLLSKSNLDLAMKYYPSRSIRKTTNDDEHDIFKVQLAGIVTPPQPTSTNNLDTSSTLYQTPIIYGLNNDNLSNNRSTKSRSIDSIQQEWINRWVAEKHTIRCTLLAKIGYIESETLATVSSNASIGRNKRPIPDFADNGTSISSLTNSDSNKQAYVGTAAVGLISYRMQPYNPFTRVDLGEVLVRNGRAFVNTKGMFTTMSNEKVIDISTTVQQIRKDLSYLERLSKAEYDACKGMFGVWANESIRTIRKDLVDEVEFQLSATIFTKLWRWFRGG